MATGNGSRHAARWGSGLAVVLAFALLVAMCTAQDDAEPTAIAGPDPTVGAEPNAVFASADGGEPVSVRLSAGTAQLLDTTDPVPVVAGEPLDDAAVATILERLPEWLEPASDRLDFNRPAETLTPPVVGATIDVPFPAEVDSQTPEVPSGPLEVVRFQPEGSVDVAPFVSITFNQPMVPLATVEQLADLDVPVTVTPDLSGRWQWIGTRTLRFEHDPDLFDRLPMATEYRVEVPAGTRSETGGELVEAVTWEFSTPAVHVESLEPRGDSLPLDPIFLATFDQRVDPEAVLESITLTASGSGQSLRLATDTEIAADDRISSRIDSLLDGRWLAFRATEAFEPATSLEFQVGPGTPSAEGVLVASGSQSFSARTYAPLHIDESSCRTNDRCQPGWPLWVRFNNPLDTDTFDPAMITVDPEPPGMAVFAEFDAIRIQGATVGGTTYRATFSEELADIYAQTLDGEATVEFVIGDAEARLYPFDERIVTLDPLAPSPSLGVTTVNHDELRVRLFKVDAGEWDTYARYWEARWDSETPPQIPDWTEVSDYTIATDSRANELTETTIDLGDALEDEPGHIVVLVEPSGDLAGLTPNSDHYWDNRPTLVWAQATFIGADAFEDDDELVLWATDLRTGEPLPDVAVAYGGSGPAATTSSDGLAVMAKPAASNSYESHVVASLGDDSALIEAVGFRSSQSDQSLWYVLDDRQMYRPGETAHLKGWVRRLTVSDDAQLAVVNPDTTITYRANDWYGNEIGSGTVEVSSLGGFDFEVDIPAGANLGEARITLNAGSGNGHSHSIQIQEFRRPEFEVATRPESAGPYLVGEPATVAVEAEYFSGGPLPDADVEWTVTTAQATYSPPNWDDYTFGVWIPWWYHDDYFGGWGFEGDAYYESDGYFGGWPELDPDSVKTFSGRTDGSGAHYLQMDFDGDGEGLPTTVTSQATVFDVNRQAWSDSTDLLVHPSELYVGLRGLRTFVESGEPLAIEAIVADIDGSAVSGRTISMEAGRLAWQLVDGQWDEVPVDVQTCAVTSSRDAVECAFATDIGGTYRVVATVTDDAGRSSRTEMTRWVSGGDHRPERDVAQEEVTLIPDQQEYASGDQAEILVEAPFSNAQGLLTISRNGVLETRTFAIDERSTVLSIPIRDEYIPNVHVQVDLVGATERTDDDGEPLPDSPGRPAFAVGHLNLQVPPTSRTLAVSAQPAAPTTEPGSTTEVTVTVADAAGDPVADAELVVVVVDEAVLALTAYELPDPLDVFYRPIGSQVWSRYLRDTIKLVNPELLGDKDSAPTATTAASSAEQAVEYTADSADEAVYEEVGTRNLSSAGSDGESSTGDAIDVRANFDALAVFEPEVRTDASGSATIEVPLPDSLTRYRVMVVAVAGVDQFGSAESNITARLPLMVRPSAPRFLNFGDRFELPVVIQNQTDEALEVDAVIQTANLTVTAGAGQRVTVPANDRIEVRFPAAAEDVGTARFRVAVVSGEHADSAVVSLPVYTPSTTEAFATYGVVDDGVVAQPVVAPDGVIPQFGGLEVNTSSTALQALTDAVIYLNDYRYESADALASRILAIAALRDVLDAFDADGLPPATDLNVRVAEDIDALLRLQTDSGGFAIWSRTRETVPYHSIQSTHALVEAKANGYEVPAQGLEQALWYVTNIEDFYPTDYSQQTRDTLSAYALHVRNLAGDRDASRAIDLYRRAGAELGLDAVAWLWPVLDDGAADVEIERLFNNRVTETAAAATFATDYGEDAYLLLYSDRRTDGIVLDALIARAPESDLIPKVVAGLLANQTRGRWNNVQENSFILLALNNYFDTFEAATPDFVARIWLGELYAAEHTFEGRTTDRAETIVPMAELLAQAATDGTDLVVSKDGEGRLYYRLGLRYAPDDFALDAMDRGFVVQRTYEAIDHADDVTRDADGTWHIQPGAEVRVRLTMVADSRRTHVALVDPMPAGFEALNPAIATSAPIPQDVEFAGAARVTYWWWQWFEHQNLRDDRAEAFASLLSAGTYDYTYVVRATTPGTFVVPPTKAEEIYAPETFGRSSSDIVIVEG